MKTYAARFRTMTHAALEHFEANSPEHAMILARDFYDKDDEDRLLFTPYDRDDADSVDEIAIEDDKGCLCAIWQARELRLKYAAPNCSTRSPTW